MAHRNPSDEELRRLLSSAETIAVVGASSNAARPSHGIFGRLLEAGYQAIPVNPHEAAVLGQKAYASLRDVPMQIDIVNVFRRAEHTPEIANEAIEIGAKALWLQSGIVNGEAAARASAAGLVTVMDDCIAVAHSRLGVAAKPERASPARSP